MKSDNIDELCYDQNISSVTVFFSCLEIWVIHFFECTMKKGDWYANLEELANP
jgi:hypothetical protein